MEHLCLIFGLKMVRISSLSQPHAYLIDASWYRIITHAMASAIKASSITLSLKAERLLDILTLGNYISFLLDGKYPTLLNRLLQMHFVPRERSDLPRQVDVEYMNRQLLWQAFTVGQTPITNDRQEFAQIFLPIFPIQKVSNLIRRIHKGVSNTRPSVEANGNISTCSLCRANDMAVSYQLNPCGHFHCYTCAYRSYEAGTCNICGTDCNSYQRSIDPHQ